MVLHGPRGSFAFLKDGSGCKQGDTPAPQEFDDTFTRKLQPWYDVVNHLPQVFRAPALVVEDEHSDALVSQNCTVLADDVACAGSFTSVKNFIDQVNEWDKVLDRCLRDVNLVQNKTQKNGFVVRFSRD